MYKYVSHSLIDTVEEMVLLVFKLHPNFNKKALIDHFKPLKESILCVQIHLSLADLHYETQLKQKHFTISKVCLYEFKSILLLCNDLGELPNEKVNALRILVHQIELGIKTYLQSLSTNDVKSTYWPGKKIAEIIGPELDVLQESKQGTKSENQLNEPQMAYQTIFHELEEWWIENRSNG